MSSVHFCATWKQAVILLQLMNQAVLRGNKLPPTCSLFTSHMHMAQPDLLTPNLH